ncbi:MAG: bifunctional 5,10-methylene-tetrahydrofolate dehydrogenase/ 5,10-methylene-tetrahydrofolate cyclohydrolase [Microgenomates group bacterium GW2011_GWA1_46_7]|nr:MAG: bifunctional 5,10-methylene-tetrahydrofolate dehydrogenase/ 5,10-methylene-tetrahydrofolate cyclohydrolase [Microgenomates group bacterium GW2011_GWA1_46_7]
MLFDGKRFAVEIEEQIRQRVSEMETKPKIVSVLVGSDPASELYTRLKSEAAKRVGVEFEVVRLDTGIGKEELEKRVREIGEYTEVTGLMVQLPIPGLKENEVREVLAAIPLTKDVDGLRSEESGIMPATVRAIISIMESVADDRLWQRGDLAQADTVISCVGKPGLITGEMVRSGIVAIDVGAPQGDMTKEVYAKARVAVPVPNGVGPVTIACLMENLGDIYVRKSKI